MEKKLEKIMFLQSPTDLKGRFSFKYREYSLAKLFEDYIVNFCEDTVLDVKLFSMLYLVSFLYEISPHAHRAKKKLIPHRHQVKIS
ncbi:hypothetical protein [Bacillus sp. CGMCC 1.60114]|uniref:hypothetical protein n=1 Tax=unclassified Bacillus (in: firmicutes) TaxID=185979 RepID=UPI00366BEBCB